MHPATPEATVEPGMDDQERRTIKDAPSGSGRT